MVFKYRAVLAIAATTLAVGCGTATQIGAGAGPTAGLTRVVSRSQTTSSKPAPSKVTLAETGSTLLFPLFGAWASAYHQQFGNITITTAGTGSGEGIADASTGKADIGASDAFLSSGNLVQYPKMLNIPLAISAQQINYNVPGLHPAGANVRLNGEVLAEMYQGTIANWRDPAIAALNKGITFPDLKVVPLHRMEGSGDTFLFSSYLSTDDPAWNTKIGYGTTIAWPAVQGAKAETGNSEMVTGCQATPGCVAYIGISYLDKALAAGLGEAKLQNASGDFVLPDSASMRAAVTSFVSATPDNETISMVNGPAPTGYPVVNFEYAIVAGTQSSSVKARDIRAFLHWAITSGNSAHFLNPVRFQPLPGAIVTLADEQIARIR